MSSSSREGGEEYPYDRSSEELFDVENDGIGPAVVVRGTEQYRFEPVAVAQHKSTKQPRTTVMLAGRPAHMPGGSLR